MTEFIEGVISEVRPWKDKKGANVRLHDDTSVYYYDGKMEIPRGAVKMEVKGGEGEHSKEFEILNVETIKTNPALGRPPPLPPGMSQIPQGARMVQMPFESMQAMMQNKMALKESKTRSLEAAVRIYAAMSKIEKDPKAAAQEAVVIAKTLEGYLL